MADLVVVTQAGYFGGATGFHLGPQGGGSHTIVFRLDNAPTSGAVQVHFDYTSVNGGNTTDDGPVFSIGTTATSLTQIQSYANSAGWVGTVSSITRDITFNYNISGSTVNVTSIVDPIILDLGAHGISLSNVVSFDMDGDGRAASRSLGRPAKMACWSSTWTIQGRSNSGREILSPWFNGGGFAHALDALASLDSNGDGVIDANDAEFGALRVWVDANSNGVTDAGELFTLADLGIPSISLATSAGSGAIDGQNVLANGTFTYADGRSASLPRWSSTRRSTRKVLVAEAPKMWLAPIRATSSLPATSATRSTAAVATTRSTAVGATIRSMAATATTG